jgi:hypothetical protein
MDRWIPKQQKNPVKAIREMCIECMGGGKPFDLIEGCVSKECALFTFRLGSNPYRKTMSDARREKARKTMKVTMAELN